MCWFPLLLLMILACPKVWVNRPDSRWSKSQRHSHSTVTCFWLRSYCLSYTRDLWWVCYLPARHSTSMKHNQPSGMGDIHISFVTTVISNSPDVTEHGRSAASVISHQSSVISHQSTRRQWMTSMNWSSVWQMFESRSRQLWTKCHRQLNWWMVQTSQCVCLRQKGMTFSEISEHIIIGLHSCFVANFMNSESRLALLC